jgi:hypothetical protein
MKLQETPIETLTEIFLKQYQIDALRAEDYRIEVYFDTYDVYPMIQGFWSLETTKKGGLDKGKIEFDDTLFLLRGLAYFGRIHQLKIFQPHMLEIIRLMERDHCFPIREIPTDLIEKLFNLLQLGSLNMFRLNGNATTPKIRTLLNKIVKKSKNLFKAYYIFVEPIWIERAKYLLSSDEAVIQADQKKYEINSLVESDLFQRIYKKLNFIRATRRLNNFRDALSLCMLRRSINLKAKILPLMLASSDIIREIAEDPEFKDEFSVFVNNEYISLLKSPEFFLFDFIFTISHDSSEELFLRLNNLKKNRRVFFNTVTNEEFIATIKNDISVLVDQEFLEILSKISKDIMDFNKSVDRLLTFQKAIRKQEVQKEIEAERTQVILQLRKNISDLDLYEEIWEHVDRIKDYKFNEKLLNQAARIDIFKDLGLTRFSPSEGKVEMDIRRIWDDLLYEHSGDDDIYFKAQLRIVNSLFEGLKNINHDMLTVGCCILWVFEAYDLISKLLLELNFNYGDNYTLAVIHASSLCMSNHPQKREVVERIINHIMSQAPFKEGRYKVLISLSYVHFRLWESEQDPHFIIDRTPEEFHSEFYDYAKSAISFAERAHQWLRSNRNKVQRKVLQRNVKYYYALNIYIYYVSRAGSSETFLSQSFENLVETFQHTRDLKPQYWQNTFDHTLATYYFRKFALEGKEVYLSMANNFFEDYRANSLFEVTRLAGLGKLIELEIGERNSKIG